MTASSAVGSGLRVILASASPARRQTLIAAGLAPEIIVSEVDEDSFSAAEVTTLVATLAQAKAESVFATLDHGDDVAVIGCDSLLELDGQAMGKPADAAQAIARWQQMRGQIGYLRTGHEVILRRDGVVTRTTGVASTAVHFADLSDAEIEAYVATEEPLWVAGAFTIDGLGGAYISSIEGDPHAVVGISLPLLRELLGELGVAWHTLWDRSTAG